MEGILRRRTIDLDEGATPQVWTEIQQHSAVEVLDAAGFTYIGTVLDKTADSSVVWIIRDDLGSRHCIHNCDGLMIRRL
jgi:hypothetical protein